MRSFVILLIAAAAIQSADINFTLQKAWNTNGFCPLYSAGLLINTEKIKYTYYEFGISFLPRLYQLSNNGVTNTAKTRPYALYGLYGGYYLSVIPAFRPGVILGTVLTQNADYYGNSKPKNISKLQLNYYAGLSIHVFLLSFIITNNGIGGGINIPLG